MTYNSYQPFDPVLPMGSSLLEQRAAKALQQAVQNAIPIKDLINPDRCPEPFLPYLAWAFSVDKWDEHWAAETKRYAIKQSFLIHRHKGTIAAIRRVVEPIGYLAEVKEWWQENPMGEPGSFQLTMEVSEDGLNEETYKELARLVDDVKPVSRHLTLAISLTPTGNLNAFIAGYESDILTIYGA